MPKILYMLPAEKFGGAERQGILAIKLLPKFGVDVLPVVGPGRIIVDEMEREGIKDYVFNGSFPDDKKHPLTFIESVKRIGYNYGCFLKSKTVIESLVKEHACDLIFATRTFSWIVAGFVSRKTGVPAVWRCGSRFTSGFQRHAARAFVRWTRPAGLVVNCKAMEASFGPGLGTAFHVIPSPVDPKRFDPSLGGREFKERSGIAPDIKVIGIAARPAPEKGPKLAADMMKVLLGKRKDIMLLWAGESSWRPFTERIFAENGLSGYYRFLGHVDRIEEFYAACDVLVLTSKERSIEASPNAVLEPMSMAKPVVATRVGGIPEIIDDGRDGFLVKPGDSAGFADVIDRVLSDKSLAEKIGGNARAKILKERNMESSVKKLADVLKSKIGKT